MTVHYHAFVNQPGYLPDSDEPSPTFVTAERAWQFLLDDLTDEELWEPIDPNDQWGPQQLTKLAAELEHAQQASNIGTVYGSSLAYSVEACAEEDCGSDDD